MNKKKKNKIIILIYTARRTAPTHATPPSHANSHAYSRTTLFFPDGGRTAPTADACLPPARAAHSRRLLQTHDARMSPSSSADTPSPPIHVRSLCLPLQAPNPSPITPPALLDGARIQATEVSSSPGLRQTPSSSAKLSPDTRLLPCVRHRLNLGSSSTGLLPGARSISPFLRQKKKLPTHSLLRPLTLPDDSQAHTFISPAKLQLCQVAKMPPVNDRTTSLLTSEFRE